jgi:hypothetical protein
MLQDQNLDINLSLDFPVTLLVIVNDFFIYTDNFQFI